MAFCSKCGTELADDAVFCSSCGTPTTGTGTGPEPGQTDQQQQAQPDGGAQPGGYEQQNYGQNGQPAYGQPNINYNDPAQDVQANKVYGILAYLSILVLVTIFAAPKESRFSKFHANQGLVLFIVEVGGAIAVGITVAILTAIFTAIGLWYIFWLFRLIWVAFYALMLVLAVIGIINAANGKTLPLPVIGKIQILR
jgi:uncharacterized membrane protein